MSESKETVQEALDALVKKGLVATIEGKDGVEYYRPDVAQPQLEIIKIELRRQDLMDLINEIQTFDAELDGRGATHEELAEALIESMIEASDRFTGKQELDLTLSVGHLREAINSYKHLGTEILIQEICDSAYEYLEYGGISKYEERRWRHERAEKKGANDAQ
jgi:DNA-binding transcriptional ArsR family regulator